MWSEALELLFVVWKDFRLPITVSLLLGLLVALWCIATSLQQQK